MSRRVWLYALTLAAMIAVGVESVQEKDVSSVILVACAVVGLVLVGREGER